MSTPGEGRAPWDALLLERESGANLVSIARDRRLVLEDSRGPHWVDLCWVDEAALALVDIAVRRGQSVDLVYPAPAGSVGVLLAAQLLLAQFLGTRSVPGAPSPSVGLVTADPTMAERIGSGGWSGGGPVTTTYLRTGRGQDDASPVRRRACGRE